MKGTHYTIEVRDKEGKLLKRERRKSRSFVQAWNKLMAVQASAGSESITDTGGEARAIAAHANNFQMLVVAGIITHGLVVGRGSTAVTITDTALETICAEGTETNQLSYLASTPTEGTVSGSDCSFTVTRSAINNSGAAITITEIGIYIKGGSTPYYFLGVRDVLVSSVEIPDGGGITVVYTIKVTV